MLHSVVQHFGTNQIVEIKMINIIVLYLIGLLVLLFAIRHFLKMEMEHKNLMRKIEKDDQEWGTKSLHIHIGINPIDGMKWGPPRWENGYIVVEPVKEDENVSM
jgi:hypothetical protein